MYWGEVQPSTLWNISETPFDAEYKLIVAQSARDGLPELASILSLQRSAKLTTSYVRRNKGCMTHTLPSSAGFSPSSSKTWLKYVDLLNLTTPPLPSSARPVTLTGVRGHHHHHHRHDDWRFPVFFLATSLSGHSPSASAKSCGRLVFAVIHHHLTYRRTGLSPRGKAGK